MATPPNLAVDGARLWDSLEEMARIGATPKGGCNRQTLTPEDAAGRALFARWCEAAGLTLGTDSMGTMFARREGAEPGLDPVAIGSHLDTQPTGGKYDGVLGVLAGLEAVRTLNERGIATRRPIEIVNWTNEEGARFAPAMLASGVFAGVHDEAWAKHRQDAAGVRFGDALTAIGWEGAEPVGERRFHAFFELHIEQGPILEDDGLDIGVVTGGQGLVWLDVTLEGRDSHAGTTPMVRRADALVGAARLIAAVDEIAGAMEGAVGTVGIVEAGPGSRNVVPGRASFTVDLRHPSDEGLAALDAAFRARAAQVAEAAGLTLGIDVVAEVPAIAFDPARVADVRAAAAGLGLLHRDMVSGAGHDACHIAKVAPTAMVFCPCIDGLSHNEAEAILPGWAENGANVLLHAALAAAEAIEPR